MTRKKRGPIDAAETPDVTGEAETPAPLQVRRRAARKAVVLKCPHCESPDVYRYSGGDGGPVTYYRCRACPFVDERAGGLKRERTFKVFLEG